MIFMSSGLKAAKGPHVNLDAQGSFNLGSTLGALLGCSQVDEKSQPRGMLLGEGSGAAVGPSGEAGAQGAYRTMLQAQAQWRRVPLCLAVSAAGRS